MSAVLKLLLLVGRSSDVPQDSYHRFPDPLARECQGHVRVASLSICACDWLSLEYYAN